MLTIRKKIEDITKQLSLPLKFYYTSDRELASVISKVDVKDEQVVVRLRQIEEGQYNLNTVTGAFKESHPDLSIQFLTLGAQDYTSIENDRRIQYTKGYAKEFLLLLEQSELFEPLTAVRFYHVYNATKDILTGVELLLPLIELDSQDTCL